MKRIEIDRVTKTFPGPESASVHALQDVSLDVAEGRFLVLLGPSGSGKTTLLRCIAGLEQPTEGEIRLGEETVFSSSKRIEQPPEKRNLGMVFQSYALWPHLSVADNVAYPLKRRQVRKAEIRERVLAALEMVHCAPLANRYPHEVSGGQQQRVALARAIVAEPSVMLFDEPLSNLDAGLRERMRAEIKLVQQKTGCTALYVTHDQREAMAVADEVVVMDGGRVLQVGPPDEVYARPTSSFVASFLGAANLIDVRGNLGPATFQTDIGPLTVNARPAVAGDVSLQISVRQESIMLLDGPAPAAHNAVDAVFEYSEFLGDHRLATFRCASGQGLTAKLPPTARLRAGDPCALGFPVAETVLVSAGNPVPEP